MSVETTIEEGQKRATGRMNWWGRVVAMLLLMLGMSVSDALALTARYYIVNNKGKVAFNYASTSSTLSVDPKAQSIYAENFRFYTSLTDAQTDASTSGASKPNVLSLGAAATDGATYYVRYDAKSTRVGNDGSKKYLIRVRNRSGVWWYIYFDKDDDLKLKMTNHLEGGSDMRQFLWQFDDGGDPYDVYITSDYADETVSGGTLSVAGVSTSNKIPYVTYQAKIADANYDQSATSAFTLQSFFFTKATNDSPFKYNNNWSTIWSNSVQLVGAYNGISYNYRDGYVYGGTFESTMPYYLCANGDPSKSGAMSNGFQWHAFRTWRAEDTSTSNVSQIQLVSDFTLFHVVNKSGDIAISKLDESPASTLTIPADIKSPYIANEDYKFFNTKTEAEAYSKAADVAARTAAAETAITTLAEVTNNTVYVGYYYDKSAKPSDLPALDGSSWYRILNRYGNADNYFYSNLNGNGNPANSSIRNSATHMTGSFTDDYHLWKLTGDDPYAIYLSNKWMNENKGNGSDLPIRYGNISQGWFRQMAGYYTTGLPMIMLGYDATYVNMAVVSEAYRLSDYEYLYFFGANGSNGSNNVQFMRNQYTTSNLYKTDRTAAALLKFVEIPVFNFHVTTPSGAELTWKESVNTEVVSTISMPEGLRRKYIGSYTFYPTQADADDGTNAITTYAQALAQCTKGENGYDIYVKYTVDTANLPFTISTDFATATWYRLKVEATAFAHLSESAQVMGTDDTYTTDYQYAFFGDPYELRVANRDGGEGMYLGVPAGSVSQEPILPIGDAAGVMNVWECYPDGEDNGNFKLRVFGSAASPMYCGYYNGKACYFTSGITMTPYELPTHKYTYHIIDNSGREAIKATAVQTITTTINYEALPEVIRSPYISGETISGYTTATATGGNSYGRSTYSVSYPISTTPIPSAEEIAKAEGEKTPIDIYIRYTTNHLQDDSKFLHLRGARVFGMWVNGEYLYDNSGTLAHETTGDLTTKNRLWKFIGSDPYAVQIKNADTGRYLTYATSPSTSLSVADALSATSFYMLMSGKAVGTEDYEQAEFMAATGEDAGSTYYNIGYSSSTLSVFDNSSQPKKSDAIQTKIFKSSLSTNYYLIDKAGKLIEGPIIGTKQELYLPDQWRSPLVSEYHYWKTSGLVGDTYSPSVALESIADAEGGNIYVTYTVGNGVRFDTTDNDEIDDDVPMYMLRFYHGESFRQEDGKDGLMKNTEKRTAIYPYSNGDANLYVYGQERWDLQLESGASTRGRWPWFVVSPTQDPYHVKIMSRQSQGKSTSHNYFYTHVVNYDAGNHVVTGVTTKGDRVVTGGTIEGVDYGSHQEPATEYMVLSTPSGRSRLVTVDKINDGSTNERRTVTSFEQYWKNYETISKKGKYSVESITNPDLAGVSLHRYQAWANARPMDPVDPTKQLSKDYLYDYHWFQTISMEEGVSGTLEAGAFSFEEIELNAVLVLLDQHGWEIARMRLPNGPSDPKRAEYYAGVRKYSSPMAKRYHYWKTGSKVPGYHRYTVADYAEDDDGNEYTTPELGILGTLPNYEKQGMVGNQSRDWYVTYDVKDEYVNTYVGAATESAVKASAFMIGQGNGSATKWLTTTNGYDITKADVPANYNAITASYLWNLRSNFNIDRELGYRYLGETGAQTEAKSKADTDAEFFAAGKNGFDPYNVQFESARYSTRYLTLTDITAAALSSGSWTSTGSGTLGVRENNVKFNASGHDQVTLNITNATFMVVDDGNGNMRLMPRFDNARVMTDFSGLSAQTAAAAANDEVGTQTLLLIKPTTYTYHVINKSGKESLRYVDKYWDTAPYVANLPDHLKAYGATNFRYLPISEFDPEPLTRGIYRLVNTSAQTLSPFAAQGNDVHIYVVYDLTPDKAAPEDADRSVADKGFNGTRMYNLALRNTAAPVDNYLTYVTASTSVTAANTSLTDSQKKEQENIWRIATVNGDPYQAQLYNFRNSTTPLGFSAYDASPTAAGTETYNTFIITNWDAANNKFELLAANSGTSDNVYGYLTYSDGAKVLRSNSRQHNSTVESNLVGFTLTPVTLTFTYKLYDLAGNLTLQGTVSDVSDITPSLPEYMRSPLVKDEDYRYWRDETRSVALTSLSDAIDNTIHVSYTPVSPETAMLRLDGSQTYTFHTKSNASTLAMGAGGRVSLRSVIGKRENYYEHTLHGREINGYYDPYDVAIYSPIHKRYWQSGNINSTSADRRDDLYCNSSNINSRFMILRGTTESGVNYVQIAQKKMNGSTYYPTLMGTVKYVYHNGTDFSTGQGTTETSYTHNGGEEYQLHAFQPTKRYHVLNMQGTEAVTAVEARLVIPNVTTPLLPEVVKSPVVKNYHYYDITSFDVSDDGVYTLKAGAVELAKLSDATTDDVYVVYTSNDIDKNWDLNGGKVYNIIFAPDALTWDDITETLNSYFGYEAGLQYWEGTDHTDETNHKDESNKFQVTGSYCTSYLRHIVVNDVSKKGEETGSRVYEVEADLTSSQIEENKWLWSLSGTDPYALQIHSMTDPSKYIYRNSDSGGYTVGLTLGTTTNTVRSTFMLTGRGTGDATRFNIMASGFGTNGSAPYSYQYLGRSYHDNPHRNTRRGVVLQGFHEWAGWSYNYNEQPVTVKIVPKKEDEVTYIVKNKQGNEAIRMTVVQSRDIKPVLPDAIKSPYAKNFKYWSDASCTVEKTTTTADATIYVTYDADETALEEAGLDLTGKDGNGVSYNIWANGFYFYNNSGALMADAEPAKFDDTVHEWYLEGKASGAIDPYDVRLRSKKDNDRYIELASYDNTESRITMSLVADNNSNEVQSFILMNGQTGRMELLAATKDETIVSTKNRLAYLGYVTAPQLLGVGNDDNNPQYQSGLKQVQVMLRQPYSGVTYHIMNLSGTEAVQYTVSASKGDALEVPEPIRSPFATNWKFWSDEACSSSLTMVPSSNADIYVTYDYNDETREQLQLDGEKFYNMKVAGKYIHESDGDITVLGDALADGEANVLGNLWAFNGTSSAGIDPYALHLVNKAYTDVYAGAAHAYSIDTETTMQMSDGETEDFRSTFFLVGSSADGPYEMVLASGVNITSNVLACVNRHSSEELNLNCDNTYQHGNDALQIQMTSPVNKYLYKVYDRSGNLAIQAWGDGVAGEAPQIPAVISSPLVSTYYYNVETLPYTSGTDEISVTYDFDSDKLTLPNLLGEKVYNLKYRNNYYAKTSSGTDVAVEHSDADNLGTPETGDAIWKPTGKFGTEEDIDPYCITLKHSNGKVLTASGITLGDNTVTLADDNTTNTYQRFILVEGNEEGRYEFMAATGDKIGSTYGESGYDMFAYLAINESNTPTLGRGEAYSRGKTAIQMELAPFQYTYRYVVVNNDMYEAVIYDVKQDGGNPAQIPDGLRSPLISLNEYEYYKAAAFSTVGSFEHPDGSASTPFVFADDATKTANKLTTLPYENLTIYVRYNYSQKSGGLDITGTSKYLIMNEAGGNQYLISASTTESNHNISNNTNPVNRTHNYFQWRLNGSDPYNIKITNVARDGFNDALQAKELWYRNNSGDYVSRDQGFEMRPDNYQSNDITKGKYKANRFAILGHVDGDYRLMAITPFFWHSDYYELSDAQKAVDKIVANQKQERYYTLDGRWSIYRHGRNSADNLLDMNIEEGLQIKFLPTTTHNYRFHLTTKIEGRKLEVEKPKTMARDVFAIPEELMRKYCDYTVTYYVNKNGSEEQQNWIPKKKEDYDGSNVVTKTLKIDGTDMFPYFTVCDGDDSKWVDIYIDYHARQHYKTDAADNYIKEGGDYVIDPTGMPFNVMGWNKASVQRLLNNTGGFTDAIFQINNYKNLTDPLTETTFGLRRCDYLYFMVVKTDNDFTNNNGQYFLRRDDTGRISWLNNDYKIYKEASKNFKGWNYSRCAEAYRENDHSVFEEKKWLFCFAGDPYDFYIFNANSVVEETYNDITSQKEFVQTHRDHLVSYTTLVNKAGTTTEYAVNTPSYSETAPSIYRWGLAMGQGTNSDKTFSLVTGEFTETATDNLYNEPTVPNSEKKPLYWRMDRSKVENKNELMLQTRDADNTSLDYNIQVLPYEPTRFEELRFVIKRNDEIDNDGTDKTYLGKYPDEFTPLVNPTPEQAAARAAESQERSKFIDALPSGTVRMYSSVNDRQYAYGDRITIDDLPVELQRKFCNYKMYRDDYRHEGSIASLPYCPIRGELQRDGEGNIVYNEVGKAMYNYYAVDGAGNPIQVGTNPVTGAPIYQGSAPMTLYIKYEVTTDKFLKKRPTIAELEEMEANNDHVYFMDFADPNLLKGGSLAYNAGHHAYYDDKTTYQSQIGQVHGEVLAEKMIWNGSSFVYDTSQKYNYCRYRTTDNRMESKPEDLKWYFVGDPYKLQVYNTQYVLTNNEPEANLCRFDPTETSFQFVVDCVHFRSPDPSFIDERTTLIYTDEDGNSHEVANNNYGKPYYSNFYWEVVPAASTDEEAFALRFRDDNQILGYRDVFYYLAHDGIKRTYREAQSENPKAYGINLSYDQDNALNLSGKYKGYHAANDANCAIRLLQPAKVYFTAYKETTEGEPVVLEELSEYFGVGETLNEVPRHLQRKFVKYGNLQYQKNNTTTWNDAAFPFALTKDNAFNLQSCNETAPVHTAANGWVYKETDNDGDPTKCRASYKFRVTYEVDDITKDGIHLFTTTAEFANENVKPQWLDVYFGNNHWMYYDKMNQNSSKEENELRRVSTYPTARGSNEEAAGWDIGIKGLHWAFIGDPYKFTILNRRRWEDSGSPRTAVSGSDFWLGTGYGQHNQKEDDGTGTKTNLWYNYNRLGDTNQNRNYGENGLGGNDDNGNTEWGLMMCKTGGAGDYFIRTSSLKQESVDATVGDYTNADSRNMTNDYARITYKQFTNLDGSANPLKSDYVLETYSLDTKTKDIVKAEIRTAVAEDDDDADNDCFDANVRIYNTNGELKATLKHVELTYGNVYKAIPPVLRRYGCDYIECYQLSYAGFTDAEFTNTTAKTAKRRAINTRLQSLNNFTGDNKIGSLTTFSDATLTADKAIVDENGRKYYEIAYVYNVNDDVSKFFTTSDDAEKDEYTWANASYQWDQVYKGTNVRVVSYEQIFDHYEYNSDGHIVNEVYKLVEKVTYKSGDNISTPAYGWVNTHDGSTQSFGDETTQSDNNNQKWAFVGDPYDFEMKNYNLYLNSPETSMYYDKENGITNSNISKSHWAIAQGLQKTEVKDGKIVKVYDDNGDPVYVYYLALIDDDETSDTYGEVIKYVTFDRSSDNKDLAKDEQYLYLKGAPIDTDPTGTMYDKDTKSVHPFYFSELMKYANMVIYHLVIAHQHSTDYDNADSDLGDTSDKQTAAKSTIRRHLAEYLHYKMNSSEFDATYLTKDESGFNYKNDDTYMVWDFKGAYQTSGKASGLSSEAEAEMKKGTLRDLVNDPVDNYIVQRVGVGNALAVPWYMKRLNCDYKLYQRNVLRSQTSSRPVYEEADAEWIAAGKATTTVGGVVYKVDYSNVYADPSDGRIQRTFVENGETKRAYEIDWVEVEDGKSYYSDIQAANGKEIKQLSDMHNGRLVLIDVVYDVDSKNFRFADETTRNQTTAWYSLMTGDEADGLVNYSFKDGLGVHPDRSAHYTNDNLWSPEGDPYGFVLHNRYSTVNGNAWDGVVVTAPTTGTREAVSTDEFASDKVVQTSDDSHNAVYEMLDGMNSYTFLMHPTSAHISNDNTDFYSYYMTMSSHKPKLTDNVTSSSVRSNRSTNWMLMASPEQLLPYFDRAGYVGGLKPEVASTFTNATYYTQLQGYESTYRSEPSSMDFTTMDNIRKLVYAGTFTAGKFTSTNLIPLAKGYYRIKALSTEALDGDEADVEGLRGARYVSGYRHLTESTQKNMTAASGALPLHLLATTAEEAAKEDALATYEGLRAAVAKLDAKDNPGDPDGPKEKRVWDEHPAMRGNIELPVAEYDPSTIFHLVPSGDDFYLETQGMKVNVSGSTPILAAGATNLKMSDIGGTVVTMRTGAGWTTGYLSVNPAHWYEVTVGSSNELQETGDRYEAWTKDGLDYAVQTTKWLLEPVGAQQEWPYNQMPLRVKVNKGGVKPNTSDEDKNYYGSLYVPFDTRLNKTIDGAFTCISPVETGASVPTTIRMSSVSQLNNMGNPQFVPAGWPVVIRTSKPVNEDEAYFVELNLPSDDKTVITENASKIRLYGEYLEKTLSDTDIDTKTGEDTWTHGRNVMVFGLPFVATGDNSTTVGAKSWYAYKNTSAVGFYTNENWYRGHTTTTAKTSNDATDAATAHFATARNATSVQRSNKYVYNNKVYYVYDWTAGSPARDASLRPFFTAIFDDLPEVEEEPQDGDDAIIMNNRIGVFDLYGRQIRPRDAVLNGTWRRNLAPGVYIVNGKKMYIE